jgi:GDSL-like lipase/acylhydrolase family protein
MGHAVLLGDSIFDNSAYVAGGHDVVRQLQARLPVGWRATRLAVDGARISDVARQLEDVPSDASHLIVSVGGNDALAHIGVLEDRANSIAAALDRLAGIRASFEADYQSMLERLSTRGLPSALCTIYNPRFPEPRLQRLGVTGLTLFNDCILARAFMHALPVLDLRLICNEMQDYANAIEPSVSGGDKIARAITELISSHDFRRGRSEIFTR